ncbi:MAG: response regulator transcription factor [Flavobacteriales bacterium]|nr:response regulator transcription factor [Flavobacteriales bacterium]MBK9075175.1 response regulator transcription factor [Flavobacteriales bacterium]
MIGFAHRRKVFKKLRVKSRTGLVRVAMEWGLA